MGRKRRGMSYAKRVADINSIYDSHVKSGLSNREIWRRYIYPQYAISERTFYNLLKASTRPEVDDAEQLKAEGFLFPELLNPVKGDDRNPGDNQRNHQ